MGRHLLSAFISGCFLLGFTNEIKGQTRVAVYLSRAGEDSLAELVSVLSNQLNKSLPIRLDKYDQGEFKGKGILLSSEPGKWPQYASSLTKMGPEAVVVRTVGNATVIIGNSQMAVRHGVFIYLEKLGYRYYFANTDWHIAPIIVNLYPVINYKGEPAFSHRRIWYGYGTGSKIADEDYNFWVLTNKLGGSMNANFGHAYEEIAIRNSEIFLKHPEWFYPVAPKAIIPGDAKFDMTKEDLIAFIIKDVEKRIETSLKKKTNDYKMISLAPSDGFGTCNTPACQRLGSITDRVYYLTNRVASAIRKKYPMTLIGGLAYGEYISPPSKSLEPNVFVGITTAFNASKYTTEQLVDEWRKKGAIIGIYDYFSWYAWDYDIPGQSLASRPTDITNNIKKYYAKGVRAYEGESSIGWVSKGLGYYLAARQMWDVNADPVAAKKEFFILCFAGAAGIMQKLWNEWENYSFTTVRENDLARWIDYSMEAERMEKNDDVKKRLFQVKSYLHYLSLYRIYITDKTEANLLPLLNFGYRKLDDGSVPGYPAFTELGNRSGIAGMAFDDKAKWKTNNRPVTSEEINQWIREDRNKLKVSEAVKEFVPAEKFSHVPDLNRYKKVIADSVPNDNAYWYTNEWVIEIKNKGVANYIDLTGDYVANPTVTRPIKLSVYPYTVNGNISSKPVLLYYEYKATMVKERISMARLNPGYYTMIIEDPVKIFRFSFSPSVNFSMVMRPERQIKSTLINYSFIYVPEGVRKFNVIKSSVVEFITPKGRKVSLANNKPEDLQVIVQKGEEGLWRLKPLYGQFFTEGIPPYLGTSAKQMLIPAGLK